MDQYEDNPQSWNLYSYVRNNPLNLVDPSGLSACDPEKDPNCRKDKDDEVITVNTVIDCGGDGDCTNDKAPQVESDLLSRRGGRIRNQFSRAMEHLGNWFRHWFGRKNPPRQPTPPATPAQPSGGNQPSQPNPVYGPPSPPVSLRNQIQQGRQVRGRFPKQANANEILYRTDGNGKITFYQTYDNNGRPVKRVDLVGPAHGGIPTPHVREYNLNVNPSTGQVFVNSGITRPALPSEIP